VRERERRKERETEREIMGVCGGGEAAHHPSAIAVDGKRRKDAKLLVRVSRVGLETLPRRVVPVRSV